ncbi:MAG: DUF4870 domain-containing protein [Akkermansiaceae bacterium]
MSATTAQPVNPPAMPPVHTPDPFATTQDDRTMGMLVHLLALLTGFIGPLILWLVKKDQSRFIDHHGKESLNFMITCFLASLIGLAFAVITLGFGMILVFPLFILIWVCSLIFEIMACIAANRGEWHRIPMTIRLIK